MKTQNDGQQFAAPKKVREDTFYTLLSPKERISAERIADGLGDDFMGSHFEKKWFSEYYIYANNEAFLEHIAEFDDTPEKIYKVLNDQLYEYRERTLVQPRWGGGYDEAEVESKWLNHTQYICRKAYGETQNEVYAEVVRWVERRIEDNIKHTEWVLARKAETQQRKVQGETNHTALAAKSELAPPPRQLNNQKGASGKQYENFSERFKEGYEDQCLKALREYRPNNRNPVIDENRNWRGKSNHDKRIVIAWIKAMDRKTRPIMDIPVGVERRTFIRQLNEYLPGLNMSENGRVWSDDPVDTQAYNDFSSKF